ncbi:hypothetical protein SLITO_v1c10380 [Spiroplasma litorale]|uniref:Lipoprotein n=1 Tax=Spiroplasma litorale TaxID=216942 RepID=A0A0K1W2U9_9MOLU|nr:hypothetical protein [Spiroplasma litorale]AKX34649.1 hypothetical protein SLITO_v1c10380 [Spiroplasma litorale]
MKKLVVNLALLIFLSSTINVYSCSFIDEKEGFFEENKNKVDLLSIENKIPEPKPLSKKEIYKKNIIKIINDEFKMLVFDIDYTISWSNDNDFFEVGDEAIIFAIKNSNLLYATRPIIKVVNYISLNNFLEEFENFKPKTNENINDSINYLSLKIEETILNTIYKVDFEIKYKSKLNDVWSKNDIIYVNSVNDSKILKGFIQYKIYLLDINTIDYKDIYPRQNQNKNTVVKKIINKISKYSKYSKLNVDYYIDFKFDQDILKDGNIVSLRPDKNSRYLTGIKKDFLIKTFNLNEIKDKFLELNNNFNVSVFDIKNDINKLIKEYVPDSLMDVDYTIKLNNSFSILYPNTVIEINPISTSEWISGKEIKLITPKIDLSYIENDILNIEVLIGKTTKEEFNKKIYEILSNNFKESSIIDELQVKYSKNFEFIVGEEKIEIEPSKDSKLFLQNNKKIKILTNNLNAIDVKKFIDNLVLNESESSIKIEAGIEKNEVKKIINSVLKANSKFEVLNEGIDYKIHFDDPYNGIYLKAGENVIFKVINGSNLLSGDSFNYVTKDFDINKLNNILSEIDVKVGDCKNSFLNKIKNKLELKTPFINFENDIDIKFNLKVDSRFNNRDEDCELINENEVIEFIIKKDSSISREKQSFYIYPKNI